MSQHLEIRDLKRQLSESQKQLGHYKIECEQMKKQMALSEFLVESNDLRKTINKLVKENEKLEAQVMELNKRIRDAFKTAEYYKDIALSNYRNQNSLPVGTQV